MLETIVNIKVQVRRQYVLAIHEHVRLGLLTILVDINDSTVHLVHEMLDTAISDVAVIARFKRLLPKHFV